MYICEWQHLAHVWFDRYLVSVPPNEYGCVYACIRFAKWTYDRLTEDADSEKKNHLFRWSSFWSWRVCKQAKLSHLGHRKSAPNCDSFWVRRLSMYACEFSVRQMQQFCLFTYPLRSTGASSEKMIFFFRIGIFCKSIVGPLSEAYTSVYTTIFVRRKDKTIYLSNQTWAKCYHSRNNH